MAASLKIKLITVGKTKEKHWRLAEDEYVNRIRRYANFSQVVVKEASFGSLKNAKLVRKAEGAEISRKVTSQEFLIALDLSGRQMPSEIFAEFFHQKMLAGGNHITFLIGGPLGLTKDLLKQANLRLALSEMTLPHELAKVVLLEQIYRAFTIINREKYHK